MTGDVGWEARMAARTAERRYAATMAERRRAIRERPDLAAFLADHPDLDDDTVAAIVRAVLDEDKYQPADLGWVLVLSDRHRDAYDPRQYCWSAAEAWAASPADCRECYEARPYPNPGQRHFGWTLWRTCCLTWNVCGHEHHVGEVWLAAA